MTFIKKKKCSYLHNVDMYVLDCPVFLVMTVVIAQRTAICPNQTINN